MPTMAVIVTYGLRSSLKVHNGTAWHVALLNVHPNPEKPEAFILELSHVYLLPILWSSHAYPVYMPDVSPDFSPTLTACLQ